MGAVEGMGCNGVVMGCSDSRTWLDLVSRKRQETEAALQRALSAAGTKGLRRTKQQRGEGRRMAEKERKLLAQRLF
jgi:hypothetical protein